MSVEDLMDYIFDYVCAKCWVERAEVYGKARVRREAVVDARHLIAISCAEDLGQSHPNIAKVFGLAGHTTVLHRVQRARTRVRRAEAVIAMYGDRMDVPFAEAREDVRAHAKHLKAVHLAKAMKDLDEQLAEEASA